MLFRDKQTDRQTDRQTNATKNITSFAKEVNINLQSKLMQTFELYSPFSDVHRKIELKFNSGLILQ